MTEDDPTAKGFSLKRWSQLKLAASRGAQESALAEESAPFNPASADTPVVAAPSVAAPISAPVLPPVESLTIDSDFTGFFQPKVEESLKRQALKQLFRDPHFNVMDGLDTYVGDYSQPDPISPEIVREMVQGRYIFNPPPTRVNDQGVVEDVPPDEPAAIVVAEPEPLQEVAPAEPRPAPAEAQSAVPLPSIAKPDSAAQ